MALPVIQDPSQNLMLVQQKWKAKLDPVFKSPFLNGKMLSNVNLNSGSTQIPHGLSGVQQGWILTDQNGAAQIYRSAPFDNTNLTLTSNATVAVNIWVF